MSTEVIVAIIVGVFAWWNLRTKHRHEQILKKICVEHEQKLEKKRLDQEGNLESKRIDSDNTVGMSELVVSQSQAQYENIYRDFQQFKHESQADRKEYKEVTARLRKTLYRFQNILSAIKFNLLRMGSRIDDMLDDLNSEEDPELIRKMEHLEEIHSAIVLSMDAVSFEWDIHEDVFIKFEVQPVSDGQTEQ